MAETAPRTNKLANETSPYLLQHAENPVDWYPWGEEAFARARQEEKPILLSVGYSTCHWCHVMAHESFEDATIAGLMNASFINIKVDREERPDIDGVYMTAVQAMTGQGGWPMTVFLTPDLQPFYAGTYFPPADTGGRPGFPRVLLAMSKAWGEQRDEVTASAENITQHIKAAAERAAEDSTLPGPSALQSATRAFSHSFDTVWGGFGTAPKFPAPGNLEFLLAHYASEGNEETLAMVETTLRHMAEGGMYDQLGGGFARYSVDVQWLVPHFEKMLYDNAQLVRLYLHAFQLTGNPLYERIIRETLAYLEREMLDPAGGFYSAQDADSEGIEGKFFLFTKAETAEIVGDDAPLFDDLFGVTPEGNFRDPHFPELTGRNIVTRRYNAADVAAKHGIPEDHLPARYDALRQRMFEFRTTRIYPGLDDKVLTSWNGLALAAFAEAARILGDNHYREVALQNAAFVREAMWDGEHLLHTWKDGTARIDGMLEDYAYYGIGLVELYKLTGDLDHLNWARQLLEVSLAECHDDERGGFYDTSERGEQLIVRQRSFFDAATPSSNGAVALLALWLGRYFGKLEWEKVAQEVVGQVADHLLEAPSGFGSILQSLEFTHATPRELVIAGDPAARAGFEAVAAMTYDPWLLLAPTAGGGGLPLFEGREDASTSLAYVCENMTCQQPARSPEDLAAQLTLG